MNAIETATTQVAIEFAGFEAGKRCFTFNFKFDESHLDFRVTLNVTNVSPEDLRNLFYVIGRKHEVEVAFGLEVTLLAFAELDWKLALPARA